MKQNLNGWLLLDKPIGLSSNQILGKLKRLFKPQKIGFLGTLDPLASGVLPIAFGEATKTIQFIEQVEKIYEFSIKWGEHRDTYDAEGDVIESSDVRVSDNDIDIACESFIGDITQVPPKYSAIKIDGKRAYDLARKDVEFEMKARPISIYDLKRLRPTKNDKSFFVVRCQSGTYVRSLAVDIAQKCHALGYVGCIRRTKSGSFIIKDTISLDFLENMVQNVGSVLLPVETGLDDIPAYALTEEEVRRLRFGQKIDFLQSKAPNKNEFYKGFFEGKLIAVLELDTSGALLKSKRIFNLFNQ